MGLEFFAHSVVGNDICNDLARVLSEAVMALPIDIYVGIHDQEVVRRPDRMTVAFQTEHFYMASRRQRLAWMRPNSELLRANVAASDLVIDLSVWSRKFYRQNGLLDRKNVVFGPYVFPDQMPLPNPTAGGAAVFFGALHGIRRPNNRSIRLAAYQETHKIDRVHRVFGQELDTEIRNYDYVANIHFIPGIYTEVPRLLKSYLNGTPMLSEELDAPFAVSRHYASILEPHPPEEIRAQMIANIFEDMQAYRLSPLLANAYYRFTKPARRAARELRRADRQARKAAKNLGAEAKTEG